MRESELTRPYYAFSKTAGSTKGGGFCKQGQNASGRIIDRIDRIHRISRVMSEEEWRVESGGWSGMKSNGVRAVLACPGAQLPSKHLKVELHAQGDRWEIFFCGWDAGGTIV